MVRGMLVAWGLAFIAGATSAAEASSLAVDPVLEARVMEIAEELRCLVCQNETLAASQSALAIDLRQQIGRQLEEGRSPTQVRAFMVDRYGEFVLYRPAFNATTALLWLGPFVLLGVAVGGMVRSLRRRNRAIGARELTALERDRVKQLLRDRAGAS